MRAHPGAHWLKNTLTELAAPPNVSLAARGWPEIGLTDIHRALLLNFLIIGFS
jgi:hypothetical protein